MSWFWPNDDEQGWWEKLLRQIKLLSPSRQFPGSYAMGDASSNMHKPDQKGFFFNPKNQCLEEGFYFWCDSMQFWFVGLGLAWLARIHFLNLGCNCSNVFVGMNIQKYVWERWLYMYSAQKKFHVTIVDLPCLDMLTIVIWKIRVFLQILLSGICLANWKLKTWCVWSLLSDKFQQLSMTDKSCED